jgi:hypothetical protein
MSSISRPYDIYVLRKYPYLLLQFLYIPYMVITSEHVEHPLVEVKYVSR